VNRKLQIRSTPLIEDLNFREKDKGVDSKKILEKGKNRLHLKKMGAIWEAY
jgi:hypothetical protein